MSQPTHTQPCHNPVNVIGFNTPIGFQVLSLHQEHLPRRPLARAYLHPVSASREVAWSPRNAANYIL